MPDRAPDKQEQSTILFAEGEAGLWLSESLILALLEAKILSTEAILEAIDIVIAAKKAKAGDGHDPEISRAAAGQLASISASIAAARVTVRSTRPKRGRRGGQKNSS